MTRWQHRSMRLGHVAVLVLCCAGAVGVLAFAVVPLSTVDDRASRATRTASSGIAHADTRSAHEHVPGVLWRGASGSSYIGSDRTRPPATGHDAPADPLTPDVALASLQCGPAPVVLDDGLFAVETAAIVHGRVAAPMSTRGTYADCDQSTGAGTLDMFDMLCFLDAHQRRAPSADCDRDGEWTVFDLLCFRRSFDEANAAGPAGHPGHALDR